MLIYDLDEIAATPYTKTSVFSYAHILHRHTFFEFTVILDGHCYSTINGGEKHTLQKGDMILIRPCDFHLIESIDKIASHRDFFVTEEKMKKICSTFSEDFYNRLMSPDFPLEYKLSANEYSSIDTKAIRLTRENDEIAPLLLDRLHTSIIVQLFGNIILSVIEKTSLVPLWLNKLHLQISQFYYVDYSISQIVATTGYTHGYVCKKFKQYYGTTLINFHNKSKVLFSVSLLGHKKIIDIATLLGWENPKNYTLEFKKVFGITPSEYVKKI